MFQLSESLCELKLHWYNEGAKECTKKEIIYLVGDNEENDQTEEEMPKRPILQRERERERERERMC